MEITFISGNANKVQQTQRYLQTQLKHQALEVDEIQSLDPYEVVQAKAQAAYELVRSPVLVEDTSLFFPHLGKLPGTFIKWFLEEIKPEGLCRLIDQDPTRRAEALILYALHTGSEVQLFEVRVQGTIAQHPQGSNGFGWDLIFIPDGSDKTYAELDEATSDKVSLRRQALEKLDAWLKARAV